MDKEKKSSETDFLLQWGTKKRLRCVKLKKNQNLAKNSRPADSFPKKRLTSAVVTLKKDSPSRFMKSDMLPSKRKVLSPEKEDRYYTTRGSLGLDESSKLLIDGIEEEKGHHVWPKLFISLSNKEKEEDFLAMKGCKPSQRPKKRAKLIQRTILLVSPGTWLSDLTQERYEVREKKTAKRRPRGLKAMGGMESDSES
ncbi:unnamed protein product [Linum trigynum]|uniref:Uncharacterized protein n=1 Tax=Linum trigynum TaxID=586398 RepID=A0AAV2EJW4_9ROSI